MNQQGLNKCWIEGKGAINGWCGIPSTVTAEIMSLQTSYINERDHTKVIAYSKKYFNN